MASQLDLQEQEQIDQLKAFWKQYGNALTWLITLVMLGFAGYNGWNWWQREQAAKAGAMFAELERAAAEGQTDRVSSIWGDLRSRYPGTAPAQQGALLAARTLADKAKPAEAQAALEWAAAEALEAEYRTIARLRLAGLLLDQERHADALAQLDKALGQGFDGLVHDRRADVLLSQNKPDEAREALKLAWKGLSEEMEYRRVVEAKLMSLGVDPKSLGGSKA